MSRFLLSCVVVLVMLAVAPAANAQLTNLYNSMEGPQTVQGINSVPVGPSFLGTFRAATSFVPTRSGDASVVSMRGQCVIPYPQGTTCQGIGEVSIQADTNGRPSGVSLGTMGFYLTDSLTTGDPVKRECGRLSPRVHLDAGTKYWAVMTAPDGIGWNDWTDDATEVLESIDDGAWHAAPNRKKLALRVDTGVDECVPDAKLLPEPGSTLGDLYVRTGGVAVNSLTLENQGLHPADVEQLHDQRPGREVLRRGSTGRGAVHVPAPDRRRRPRARQRLVHRRPAGALVLRHGDAAHQRPRHAGPELQDRVPGRQHAAEDRVHGAAAGRPQRLVRPPDPDQRQRERPRAFEPRALPQDAPATPSGGTRRAPGSASS